MLVPQDPVSSSEGVILDPSPKVNIKKQICPSKRWSFTYNNYEESDIELIIGCLEIHSAKYIIGREVGEQGTPHLQCYIEFPKRVRPKGLLPLFQGHWEKCKGTRTDNTNYCSKDGNFETNMTIDKPVSILKETDMYKWQKELLSSLKESPNNRAIYWYWEKVGNVGKTAFAKFMAVKFACICVGGKGNDIFCGINKYKEKEGHYPLIVIVDCPRDRLEYMNYGAIEQVKNGLVFSGKYESTMMVFNSPHVVIFANDEPDRSMYSDDRWIIKKIDLTE